MTPSLERTLVALSYRPFSRDEFWCLIGIAKRNDAGETRRAHAERPARLVRLAPALDRAQAAKDRAEVLTPRPRFGGANQMALALVDAAINVARGHENAEAWRLAQTIVQAARRAQ